MKRTSLTKRVSAVLVAAMLTTTMLAGCGGSDTSSSGSSTASSQADTQSQTATSTATETTSTAQTAESAAEPEQQAENTKPYEGTKLTWWTKLNANVSSTYPNLGDTPWAKYVQEQTGIEIEFQHPTAGSEDEEFSILVAGGDYPDIIEYTWTKYPGGAGAAINDGVIISLDDLVASTATNFRQLLADHPDIDKMVKDSSGRYYCFPFLRGLESPNKTQFSNGLTYRADELAALGMDVPETVDEWETFLRAMKEKGYEKPFITRGEWMKDVWSPGFDNWGSFYVDNGVVKNGIIEPSRKEFIEKLASWYKEGLISSDWLSEDKNSNQTDFTTGKAAVVFAPFGQGLGTYTQVMNEADPEITEEDIQCAAPVTSTKGKNAKFSKMNNIYDQSGSSAAISSQSSNAEAAAWLLDWLYSEEGNLACNFGIEGESYTMVNGEPVYTDVIMNNADGLSVASALAAYTRASTSGVCIQDPRYIEQYYAMDSQKKALEECMKTDMGEHFFPPTSVSEANQERYAEIMSNVNTLVSEEEAKFISGTKSMDEWDAYQEQLERFGINDAISMMQEAYDAYMAN